MLTRGRTLLRHTSAGIALVLLCIGLSSPDWARAGANETPGEVYASRSFSFFTPNQWEFGAQEIAQFQRVVVENQHYRARGRYLDEVPNLDPGFAGVWSFFNFLTTGLDDVLFVTSHGYRGPGKTLVESYPADESGQALAVRDASFDEWVEFFGNPGYFEKKAYMGTSNGSQWLYYGIAVTQSFYDDYFVSPEALAYWSTCWSSYIDMTGPKGARVYLGYDRTVSTTKCEDDVWHMLRRMNGQEGQHLRPVSAAIHDLNTLYVDPNGASLTVSGRPNTVLSPSVFDHGPTGSVCDVTPGFVHFDCTMDTRVDPSIVVVARGDGTLINHRWTGDDRIEFDVVPTGARPVIEYIVQESRARSFANVSRLDGNTIPDAGSNAWGPNHDDFVWATSCSEGEPNEEGVVTIDPLDVYSPNQPIPGRGAVVWAPIYNRSSTDEIVRVTFTTPLIEEPVVEFLPLPAESFEFRSWTLPIPSDAEQNQAYPMRLELQSEDGLFVSNGEIVVSPPLTVEVPGRGVLNPGQEQDIEILIGNPGDDTVFIIDWSVVPQDGWPVQINYFENETLDPGFATRAGFSTIVPDVPGGVSTQFQVDLFTDRGDFSYTVDLEIGLDIDLRVREIRNFVAGGTAEVDLDLYCPVPEMLWWTPTDSNNLLPSIDGAPDVCDTPDPDEPVTIRVTMPIEGLAVGQGGTLSIIAESPDDPSRFAKFDIPYTIEHPLEVKMDVPTPGYTGNAFDEPFPVTFEITNRSDQPRIVAMGDNGSDLPFVTMPVPMDLGPGETAILPTSVLVPVDAPAQVYIQRLLFLMDGVSDLLFSDEYRLEEPIRTDFIYRGLSGPSGEELMLQAVIENFRTDHPLVGTFEWWDSRGWIPSEDGDSSNPTDWEDTAGNHLRSGGLFSLSPGSIDTLEVIVSIPPDAVDGDSTEVLLSLDFFYDSGTPAVIEGAIVVRVANVTDVDETTEDPFRKPWTDFVSVHPNPFHAQATASFQLASRDRVRLTVHDASGRKVATLVDDVLSAGEHTSNWNGKDGTGRPVPAGVYFLQMTTPDEGWARKVIRVRR